MNMVLASNNRSGLKATVSGIFPEMIYLVPEIRLRCGSTQTHCWVLQVVHSPVYQQRIIFLSL